MDALPLYGEYIFSLTIYCTKAYAWGIKARAASFRPSTGKTVPEDEETCLDSFGLKIRSSYASRIIDWNVTSGFNFKGNCLFISFEE